MSDTLETKERRDPRIRVVMFPRDTNRLGSIFGGVILSQIDLAAVEHARDCAPRKYVTKIMKEVDFIAPVQVGDTVSFYTKTTKMGRTSISVKVLVEVQRGFEREKTIKVTEAEVVLVSVDDEGSPRPIRDD